MEIIFPLEVRISQNLSQISNEDSSFTGEKFWAISLKFQASYINVLFPHRVGTHQVGTHRVGTHQVGTHQVGTHQVGTHQVSTHQVSHIG